MWQLAERCWLILLNHGLSQNFLPNVRIKSLSPCLEPRNAREKLEVERDIKRGTTRAWNLPLLLIVEQNTRTAVQECVTEAGLLVLDGVWYSAGTRSQCSPQQWDKWSRRAAVEVALAPPRPVPDMARHRTYSAAGNERDAVTFRLPDSKSPACCAFCSIKSTLPTALVASWRQHDERLARCLRTRCQVLHSRWEGKRNTL